MLINMTNPIKHYISENMLTVSMETYICDKNVTLKLTIFFQFINLLNIYKNITGYTCNFILLLVLKVTEKLIFGIF